MKTLRSTAPANSILNPAFQYTKGEDTDIQLTFARARAGLAGGLLPLPVLPVVQDENMGDC